MSTAATIPKHPDLDTERDLWSRGYGRVLAIDEVGRGCLAGPVFAAGVILPPDLPAGALAGVRDSKQVSAKKRATLVPVIGEHAVQAVVGAASVREIDRHNIRVATILAIRRVIERAGPVDHVLVDGSPIAELGPECTFVVKGDARCLSIAAASILAKEARSHLMRLLHARWPVYGWDRNDGYGSASHRAAMDEHGLTPHHRRSFGNLDQMRLDL